jgi:hypothetical protein
MPDSPFAGLPECVRTTRRRPVSNNKTPSTLAIGGIAIPDSTLCRAITAFVRDTEIDLLFNHSSRVFYFAAIAGQQRGLSFNPELLYAATMFHDVGLMPSHSSPNLRFEVDGANAARDFLTSYKLDPSDIEKVWTGIALHTTPGVPEFMHPVIALTTAGVEMDVLGLTYNQYLTMSAKPWSLPSPAPRRSRKTSSKPFTTASSTSPTPPSVTSRLT